MAKEIKEVVSQCFICNSYLAKQQKEPLMTHEIPSRPWQMIGQDLFMLQRKSFLITVDYFSDFWESDELVTETSEEVIKCTKAHFARHGIPDTVITDNGPQFRATEYEQFAKKWEFKHVTSSPYHSQSNGKAESAVKIAKTMMKKVINDFQLAILNWRNTPSEGSKYSPVQKLQSRRTKSLLPATDNMLQPTLTEGVQNEIAQKRKEAKRYYDKGAKPLPELQIRQNVRVQPTIKGQKWEKAVIKQQVGPESYLVQTETGRILRRNRRFLRITNEGQEDAIVPREETENNEERTEHQEIVDVAPHDGEPAEGDAQPAEPAIPAPAPPAVEDSPVRISSRGRRIKTPRALKDYVLN